MSAALSRRVARLMVFAPIRDLLPAERRRFADAVDAAASFEELPPAFQATIRSAEVARDALRTAQRQPGGQTSTAAGVRSA
jgi:hypothetical protein